MSSRIQIAFPRGEAMPANIFPDLNWVSDNRLALYKKYGESVVVVFQKKVIGIGQDYDTALADAEAHLAENVEQITPVIGYVSNPYRLGHFYRKESQE